MQRAGQTPHGARPNREGARNFGSAHAPARRVKPPGRSLEPRSDAGPRGMAVPPGAIRRTEFGLQVRLPHIFYFQHAFPFLLTSTPPGRRIRSSLLQTRTGFGSAVCTSHHHFVATQSSMARKSSSSTPASVPATRALASCAVAASRSMRPTTSRRRDLCGYRMHTT